MDSNLGARLGARSIEQVPYAHTSPALRRTPPLDARDRKGRLVLRHGAQLVPREDKLPWHLAVDEQAKARAARGVDHAGGGGRAVHREALRSGVGSARSEQAGP